MKKSYRILQAPIPAPIPAPMLHVHITLQSREFSIQNPILHAEGKELFEYYYYIQRAKDLHSRNSTHRRQGDLLEMHPCVFQATPVAPMTLQSFQTFQSFMTFQPSRQFYNVPVFPGNPPHSSILRLEYIFYNSTILQFDWFPENSTEYQLGNYRHYKHSFFKEREMLRYRSRCQDDIFPRIELIPSFVLSSDNTNCKNDIQLFHQLFDELSVYRDYH